MQTNSHFSDVVVQDEDVTSFAPNGSSIVVLVLQMGQAIPDIPLVTRVSALAAFVYQGAQVGDAVVVSHLNL